MLTARRRSAALLMTSAILCPASYFGIAVADAQPTVYALPACYGGGDTVPTERPTQAQFQTCADGSKELTGITWTRYGPDGAEGTGTYSYNVCEPIVLLGTEIPSPPRSSMPTSRPPHRLPTRRARRAPCSTAIW